MKRRQEVLRAPSGERLYYLELFNDFLKSFWMDNSEEIAILLWKNLLNGSPRLAKEYLIALDAILAQTPSNLIELMQQHGWIILYHEPDAATVIPYTFSEHVEWLTDKTALLRGIYEKERSSPEGVLRSVLQNFFLDKTDACVLDEWKSYVKQAPSKAQIILQKLAAIIESPPPDLPQLLQTYGWIYLYHDGNETEPRPYSFSEHVEFLQNNTIRFLEIYEAEHCASDKQLAQLRECIKTHFLRTSKIVRQ